MKFTFAVNHTIAQIHSLIKEEVDRQGFEIEESDHYSQETLRGGTEYTIYDEDDLELASLIISPNYIFLKDDQFGARYEFNLTPQGVMCAYEHCHLDSSFMTHAFIPKLDFTLTGDEPVECERHGNLTLGEYIPKIQIELAVEKAASESYDETLKKYLAKFSDVLPKRFAHLGSDTPPSCVYDVALMGYSANNAAVRVISVNGVHLWHYDEARRQGQPLTCGINV